MLLSVMVKSRKFFLLSCLLLAHAIFFSRTSSAQEKPQSILEYLTAEEGARLTLETDFTTLIENRKSTEYLPATLTTADGKVFHAEVKPRGKYRRKVCEVPPIKIKFSKKMLREQGFDTLNEIKLVVPCFDDPRGDDLIAREYLIYRMFESLTAASVRARVVRMTLRDNHVERSKRQMLCLLVEDEEETCARLHGVPVEAYGISPDSLAMNHAALVVLFEYMIGNTDWDISMMRNIRLVRAPESNKVLIIPYDFDFSGIVEAPYASPSSESGLLTVRDRFLMANGISEDALKRAANTLRSAREQFYDICRSKYLPKESANRMITYLDTFYQAIERSGPIPSVLKAPVE